MTKRIKRFYVRHYTDSGERVAYVEWERGDRMEAHAHYGNHHRGPSTQSFGWHMHALAGRAKREGVKLELERW